MVKSHHFLTTVFMSFSLAGMAFCHESALLTRQDHKNIPVILYTSKENSCRGIAIISHGAGGSEKGYSYIGEAMSSHGYMTVVVGHQESGRQALRQHLRGNGVREGLSELITDPDAYAGRLMDIATAKRWAQDRCGSSQSILLGHSMGAATAMIEAGAKNMLGIRGSNTFDAYIALSPQGVGSIFPPNAWREISMPVLMITGTRDNELGGDSWKTRTEPFKNMPAGCKWLGVIDGATHMNFAGHGMSRKTEAITTQTIHAFLLHLNQGDCKPPQQERGIKIQSK